MKTKFALVLFSFSIICVFLGCKNSKKGSQDRLLTTEHSLQGELYDKDIIMRPISLFTIDSMLFIVSPMVSNGFGQIFDLNNDLEKLGEFGNIGHGPDEFVIPEPTFVGDDYFYMQDVNGRAIAKWGIFKTDNRIQASEISRLRFSHYYTSGIGSESRKINPLGDEYFVGLICDPENGYFTLYNKEMELIQAFGKPPVFEPGMSAFSHVSRLSGYLSTSGNSFAFAAMNIPYVAYYSIEKGDTIPTLKWEDTYGEISYTTENDVFRFTDKAIGLNRDIQNRDKYIYILNIDILWTQIDFNIAEKSLAKAILVYNHEGERVARLELDYGLSFFFVSEDEKTIYGITQNPDYMVVKYNMPKL